MKKKRILIGLFFLISSCSICLNGSEKVLMGSNYTSYIFSLIGLIASMGVVLLIIGIFVGCGLFFAAVYGIGLLLYLMCHIIKYIFFSLISRIKFTWKMKRKNIPYSYEEISKVIPNFDEDELQTLVYKMYCEIQEVWSNYKIENFRKYLTKDLYDVYASRLASMMMCKLTNIIKDVRLLDFQIGGMFIKNDEVSLVVRLRVGNIDCIFSTIEGKFNDEETKFISEYALVLKRAIKQDSTWLLDEMKLIGQIANVRFFKLHL